MVRLFDKVLVAVYVALAGLPVFAMVMKIRGRELYGSLEPKRKPTPTLHRVLTEKYQHDLVAWFESKLGLKGTSIAIDNAILYHAFGETKPGAPVRVGHDGVLFNDEDIVHLNKLDPWLPDPAHVKDLADQMLALQRRLAAEGRGFVPMIVPAKTSIWRDKVPAHWRLDLPDPPPSDVRGYFAMKHALDERGVVYVDVRALFAKYPRADVFGARGRHWTPYGACLALAEVTSAYARLTGKPRPPHTCQLERKQVAVRSHTDFDLLRLMNAAWTAPTHAEAPEVHHPVAPPGPRPKVLFVGTSFCWQAVFDAHASGVFGSLYLSYYNQTFSPWPDGEDEPVKAGTDAYRRIVLGNDLYVLDLFESFLAMPGAYVPAFLGEFRTELDR